VSLDQLGLWASGALVGALGAGFASDRMRQHSWLLFALDLIGTLILIKACWLAALRQRHRDRSG
jgi:sugar phosphate permease